MRWGIGLWDKKDNCGPLLLSLKKYKSLKNITNNATLPSEDPDLDLPRVVRVHQPKSFLIYIILLTQVLSPPVTSPLKIYSLSVPLFLRFRSK